MLANDSDSLLFHVPHLPGVQMRTIFLCALTTLAREVDTNQLRHLLWEDVGSLHVRLVKEKHSHVTDVAFGRIGYRRTTGLLQTLVCWGPLVSVLSVLAASDPLLYFGEKDGRKMI